MLQYLKILLNSLRIQKLEPVDRVDQGLGTGYQDVGVGAMADRRLVTV